MNVTETFLASIFELFWTLSEIVLSDEAKGICQLCRVLLLEVTFPV